MNNYENEADTARLSAGTGELQGKAENGASLSAGASGDMPAAEEEQAVREAAAAARALAILEGGCRQAGTAEAGAAGVEEAADDEADSSSDDTEEDDGTGDDSDDDDDDDEGDMSLIAHLSELRERLIRSLIVIGLGSAVCYYFIEDIMALITGPAGKLYYMYPAEAFFTYLKIAIFSGFLLTLPYVFYQAWKFVLPALTLRERTIIGVVVPVSVLLFFAGLAFSFFLIMPLALKFFLGFGTAGLEPMLSINRYFDFMIAFILPFGFVFELPVAVVILAKLGIVSSAWMSRKRRMVIFMSFVIGAVVSPTPDIFTQTMIAVPMLLLYELSLFIVKYILHK